MASRKQKRVLRYVEEGSLLKLKSYLRKHPDIELNFTKGSKGRTPLHLACSLGDDAVLRLLLKWGADPLSKDRKGDTPLHLAANRALKHGKRAYDDLVVPLRKRCPVAMETPNRAGVTPQDTLQWMKEEQFQKSPGRGESSKKADPEKEWRNKLFGECQDEFFETFGQYEGKTFHSVSMASRKQKRVLRYVEEGSLLKLKSYLRKHPDIELNFTKGSKGRTPLHLACSLGDDAVLRLLLKWGADPLSKDRKGDTPLHLAANRALKHGKRGTL
ncbi:UNVERIFIED_CONTAM: hypothetical protein FKN15_061616 [Acipenser sinensis]